MARKSDGRLRWQRDGTLRREDGRLLQPGPFLSLADAQRAAASHRVLLASYHSPTVDISADRKRIAEVLSTFSDDGTLFTHVARLYQGGADTVLVFEWLH